MKINILHLIDELERGGKERQFLELLKGIDKNRFSVYTIVFKKSPTGYDKAVERYSKKFQFFLRKFRWDIFLLLRIIRFCRQNGISIVHSWDSMSSFYGYFACFFIKINFINGSIRDTDRRLTYRHLIQRVILRLSRHVLSNSYEGLRTYHVFKKGNVIYNGLDSTRVVKTKRNRINNFIIGIVANLTAYKDYPTFFKAIYILSKKIHHMEVHIIGGGDKFNDYFEYAKSLNINDIVKYYGRINNPEDYIPNFDVGVLCSYKERGEGLSNSVLEYMACGVPPVITNIGASREIIPNAKYGALFEAGNSQDLAEKIFELYKMPEKRRQIGVEVQKFVSERFSLPNYIKNTENYYVNVLNEHTPIE